MQSLRVDKNALQYALLEVAQHLIVGRRILVSDWPPNHKQEEYEEEFMAEEDILARAADAGLDEPSSLLRVIH